MAESVIEAVELVAGYVPEVNILNGCNLTLATGEFVGIIGPNGAGKSTLLKAVLGLVHIRSGSVTLDGDDITGRKAYELVARGVGFVPQTRNVFPSLTVRENLEMGCFLQPDRFSDRFQYVTTLFPRLGERADQRAGSLSGGERQMVAMFFRPTFWPPRRAHSSGVVVSPPTTTEFLMHSPMCWCQWSLGPAKPSGAPLGDDRKYESPTIWDVGSVPL